MAKFKRRQLFVDPKVQGALVLRLLGYWATTVVTTMALVLCWRMMTASQQPFDEHLQQIWSLCGPPLIASLLILPLLVIDCVRMSNRFVGPLYRIRRCMRDILAGVPVPPIHFRDDDFWLDVVDEFNALAAKLQRLEDDLAEARGQSPFGDESFEEPVAAHR
jgi:hypothetical protein